MESRAIDEVYSPQSLELNLVPGASGSGSFGENPKKMAGCFAVVLHLNVH